MTKSSAEIPRIQRSDVARSELDTSVQSTTVLAQLISQRNVWTFEGIYYMNATPVDPWREASLIQGRTTKDWRSRRETGQGHGKKSAESLWLSLFFRFINIKKNKQHIAFAPWTRPTILIIDSGPSQNRHYYCKTKKQTKLPLNARVLPSTTDETKPQRRSIAHWFLRTQT